MMTIQERIEFLLMKKLKVQKSFKSVFDTPDGEVVLEYLMKQCGLLNPKIIKDKDLLLIQQGQRHIVLSILNILGKDQYQITKQIKESLQHDNELET